MSDPLDPKEREAEDTAAREQGFTEHDLGGVTVWEIPTRKGSDHDDK